MIAGESLLCSLSQLGSGAGGEVRQPLPRDLLTEDELPAGAAGFAPAAAAAVPRRCANAGRWCSVGSAPGGPSRRARRRACAARNAELRIYRSPCAGQARSGPQCSDPTKPPAARPG